MGYLLAVVVLPAVAVAAAVALLAAAFRRGGRPALLRILAAIGLLALTGLWIFLCATGGGYSIVAAGEELVVASAAALVGALVLISKPPRARRVAAILLITAYPLILIGLAQAGSLLSPGGRFVTITIAQQPSHQSRP